MTIQTLKDSIEEEFGWLTPDEKQKLLTLLKSNWNQAINNSLTILNNEDKLTDLFFGAGDTKHEFKEALDQYMTNPIKELKL